MGVDKTDNRPFSPNAKGGYLTRENVTVALLSFSAGLPILMTFSTLSYWLGVYGVSREMIGLASVLGLPYILKPLWAPFLDLFRPPLLGGLGRRKGWILFFQILLFFIYIGLAHVTPDENLLILGLLIFLLAFSSASQDIVIDAFRIDYLSTEAQSYGASTYQLFYRIAMLVMGAGAIWLSDIVEWRLIFFLVAALYLIIIILTALIPEPKERIEREQKSITFKERLAPFFSGFKSFFTQDFAGLILLFVICFKLPDAIAGAMANPFYIEMGYSGKEIATVTKIYGGIATMVGALLAGALIIRLRLYRALLVSTILIGITNLGYLLVVQQQSLIHLVIAIGGENFISGFAASVFIMYLSMICDPKASATQYALLSAFAALGARIFGAFSGFLVTALGWGSFLLLQPYSFCLPYCCYLD